MNTLPISCWAAEDIPVNRAENMGYNALTDAELLSIIIGSGTQDCNAIETARIILNRCNNNLSTLSKMELHDFNNIKGVGRQKAARIMACMELSNRRNVTKRDERPDLCSATRIYNHYLGRLRDLDVEEFWVTFLNQNFKQIKDVRISRGGLTETPVDVRIIAREAVLCNATQIVCVHNHPSGSLSPSKADDSLTTAILKMCGCMRLILRDHVIVTDGAYYSYREQGKI
jgi:DNA repair protein RadC